MALQGKLRKIAVQKMEEKYQENEKVMQEKLNQLSDSKSSL